MSDPSKFPIEFVTVADTSGAEAAQKAIRDTEAAAKAAGDAEKARMDEKRREFDQERERESRAYEERRKQQENERGGNTPGDSSRRAADAADALNTRERVRAMETLVSGLNEAPRKMREFEKDLRDVNPELADMAAKAADATDGLSRIGQGALQGFAAGGPVGAGIGAVGSALMYMVDGLMASNRAEKEFEENLRRTNAQTERAKQEALARADALQAAREAARSAADAEAALNEKLDAGGEALDKANSALRERLELLARQSKDQAEIIRLEEDLERKRIAASTMSNEEKANATNASREREAARLAALEDEKRKQEANAYARAAAAAREEAEKAEGASTRMGSIRNDILGKDERESIEAEARKAEEAMLFKRRDALRARLARDREVRGFYPGIDDREELDSVRDQLDATARQAREAEAQARREQERIAAEQAQADRVRGFQARGTAIDRERDARAGRRRDLEERGRDTDDAARDLGGRIASEAGAAAGRAKTDIGREMLQAIKNAFADGVLSDSERNELAAAFKTINQSKDQEVVGTLRELLSAYQATQNEVKSIREAVKALRDR